jgi:hypothetical protein
LEERGDIEIWFNEKALGQWHPEKKEQGRGRPKKYSDAAIECSLIVKYVYKLAFRQMQGFIKILTKLLGLEIEVPDYSTVCKRQAKVDVELISKCKGRKKIYVIFDSSGFKIFGEGEWKVRQHGYSKRRKWVKIHVGLGIMSTGETRIESVKISDKDKLDGQMMSEMLDGIEGKIGKILGDGAYGAAINYEKAVKRKAKLIVPPKKGAKINLEKARESEGWRAKNEAIRSAHRLGKDRWKEKMNYHKRSLVENMFFRLKTMLGPGLDARSFGRQEIEALIKCKILNRVTEIGMPDSYKVA